MELKYLLFDMDGGFMELRYLLFDMDGVILNSKNAIFDATEYTLAQYGKTFSEADGSRIIGPPLFQIYTEVFGFDPDTAREAVSVYRKRFEAVSRDQITLFDGAREMLEELSAHGKKLMTATARLAKDVDPLLEHLGIRQFFCYVGGLDPEDSTGGIRSKEAVIRKVLETNDIRDRECAVMIGDRAEDILGGKANGLKTFGALYGFGSEKELSGAGADWLAASPHQLSRHIIEDYE